MTRGLQWPSVLGRVPGPPTKTAWCTVVMNSILCNCRTRISSDLRLTEVKAKQVPMIGEAHCAHLVGHGTHVPIGLFGLDDLVHDGCVVDRFYAGCSPAGRG